MVVLSQPMANSIYDHKGQSLHHFLNALKVPVLIAPDEKEVNAVQSLHRDVPQGKVAI
jgi:hypothetical protein